MSTEQPQVPARQQQTIRQLVVNYEAQFKNALPSHMDSKRFVRILLTELTRNPNLGLCTADSLMRAALQSAQVGLEPDSVRGQAYLIPYGKECTFVPGYRGMIELAYRSGRIDGFGAHVVYEGDKFELEFGTNERLIHVPAPATGEDRRVIGAYSIVRFKGGGCSFEFMWEQEIQALRKKYVKAARQDSPWNTAPDEMRKKTVVRRHAKFLPQCPELQLASQVDEALDRGEAIDVTEPEDLASAEAAAATSATTLKLKDRYKDEPAEPGSEG